MNYDDEMWVDEEDIPDEEEDYPDKSRKEHQQARLDFETSGRAKFDSMLEEARKSPTANGFALPTPEETAWMTEEERRCVEWFDRREYDTFMKRSAWYEGDGWIIPYCRMICEELKRASPEVLESYANDYIKCYWFPEDLGGNIYVGGEMSREDRFLRVADKIFAAARAGNARAQNAVGTFCEEARPRCVVPIAEKQLGVKLCDGPAAREWYRNSAEGGCLQGQRNYARALMKGIGGDWRTIEDSGAATWHRDKIRADRQLGVEWYRKLAEERNDGECQMRLASIYAYDREASRNVAKCAEFLRKAAQGGHPKAIAIVKTAGADGSDERLLAELMISDAKISLKQSCEGDLYDVAYSVGSAHSEGHGKDWLLKDKPEGTVVPPAMNRETVRTPNLTSANPSFAARLIIFVRDRFGGDAPAVYNAAHVSRKTYSAIVSNELRPVSKQTAIAFALALRLSDREQQAFLAAAGFALSEFMLDDMIVRRCIIAGIYDIDRVNEILALHGERPFPSGTEVS